MVYVGDVGVHFQLGICGNGYDDKYSDTDADYIYSDEWLAVLRVLE